MKLHQLLAIVASIAITGFGMSGMAAPCPNADDDANGDGIVDGARRRHNNGAV